MEIKVLGMGCPRCRALEQAVINGLAELDIPAEVNKIEDINIIMEYGIIRTPGLVINGKVVMSGRIPSEKEMKELLIQNKPS